MGAGVVSATYRSIKSDELIELLNISKTDLDKLVKERGWTKSKEDKEKIVVNTASFESAQQVKPKGPTNMSLDQYKTLLHCITADDQKDGHFFFPSNFFVNSFPNDLL